MSGVATTTVVARTVGLTKVYGTGDTTVRALDGVDVAIESGRFTAIMGPSGSGKSTLMHCLAGLDDATSGHVFVNGIDLSALSDKELTRLRRERLGFVFQAYNLLPTLTALENISLPSALAGRRLDPAWLDAVIDAVGLRDRLSHRPSELSGGQQQRVAVARALAGRPAIIFADEPTGNLDSRTGGEILGFLRRAVTDLDQTIVMVTHDPASASYADGVVFLSDGLVVDHLEGPTPQSVLDRLKAIGGDVVLRLTLKGIWAHKRRLVSTVAAVFIGVAFLSGTLALGDTLRSNFDGLFTETNAGTGAVIRSATSIEADRQGPLDVARRGLVDASLATTAAQVGGVAAATASVQGYGQLIGKDGGAVGGNGPPRLAGNWITDASLNPYRIVEGRPPQADDEVVINRGAAISGGLHVGDTTTVETPDPITVHIVGIATYGTADGAGQVTFTAFTLPAAQRYLTGGRDQATSILVQADGGVAQDELVARLQPVLPTGTEAITGAALTRESIDDINATFLDVLTGFLTVFAGVALLVGAFSIFNTFSILVAQRTRESALLRALGANRRQVIGSVVLEALLVGVLASITGLFGGIAVAGLLKAMFDAFGFALPAGGLTLTATSLVVPLIVGTVVTLGASLAPAVRASRVPPLAAMRGVAVDGSGASPTRAVAGVVVFGAGVAVTLIGAVGDAGLAIAGVGALLTIVGVVVFGPVVARIASGIIGAPVRRLRGVTGALARDNAMRNPRRTAGTASALMVGVAVVTLFTVFAASLGSSLDGAVNRTFAGDLAVTTGGFGGGALSPRLATQLAALPEVRAAAGLGRGVARIDGQDEAVTVADPAELAQVLDLDVVDGALAAIGDGVAVSAGAARSHHWSVGSAVPVTFTDGTRASLPVGAIYDEDDIPGPYIVPRSVWAPHAVQDLDTTVYVTLADGVGLDQGRAAVAQVTDGFGHPNVLDRSEYVAESTQAITIILGLVYVMLALAVVIALLGIANTLSLSIFERTRELGLLRVVGASRGRLRSMVRWESVIIALFGTIGGLGVGMFLGWALTVVAVDVRSAVFTAPVTQLLVVLVAGGVAGVLAAVRPARRAARLDVLAAIASE